MKAIAYYQYGPPEVLRYEDLEKRIPADGEVLIKVRAAGVNPLDWHFMRGEPYPVRLMTGMGKPKVRKLGVDVAGVVEAAGRNAAEFKPGDAVFGSCRGAFSEYVCTSESSVVLKPERVTFEQAAGVPVPAFTALQGMRDKGRIQTGQEVLINGAAGGVGTLAVQIAKSFGARVTGVCSTRNVEMVLSLGAEHVIDYTREDFAKGGQRYDLIFDLVGNRSFAELRRVMTPKGVYVGAGGEAGKWMIGAIARSLAMPIRAALGSQTFTGVLAKAAKADLAIVSELMAAGKVTPVIDRCYGLSEVPAAIAYLEEGHARGKVIVSLG